ncbi:MAG: hypothetical protein AAFY76_12440, partial [Cyanobacteria bacterium J06649_11]
QDHYIYNQIEAFVVDLRKNGYKVQKNCKALSQIGEAWQAIKNRHFDKYQTRRQRHSIYYLRLLIAFYGETIIFTINSKHLSLIYVEKTIWCQNCKALSQVTEEWQAIENRHF